MATTISRETLRTLARLGAERRLEQLRQEEAEIRAEFPELFGGAAVRRGPGRPPGSRGPGRPPGTRGPGRPPGSRNVATAAASQEETQTRRRRRGGGMSAAQRKAVSERMRKYWAARRKAKNG